ncbi:MAG: hypothetical protein ACRDK4_11170 [Solirubrobacteraceae bacterium]
MLDVSSTLPALAGSPTGRLPLRAALVNQVGLLFEHYVPAGVAVAA